jgi:hypothetical protein
LSDIASVASIKRDAQKVSRFFSWLLHHTMPYLPEPHPFHFGMKQGTYGHPLHRADTKIHISIPFFVAFLK